jgi:hypothetical protein
MAAITEERFAALEAEVARLRAKVEGQHDKGQHPNVTGRTRPDFLDTMFGIHANSPDFKEVTCRIMEEREREREEANRLLAADEAVQ